MKLRKGSITTIRIKRGSSRFTESSRCASIILNGRLDNPTVRSKWRQVAWRIKEPEPFPFVNDHSQVFTGEQQLLNTTFRTSGIDRQKATDRSRKADGQNGQLQGAAHRGFLHERERQFIQRSVTLGSSSVAKSAIRFATCRNNPVWCCRFVVLERFRRVAGFQRGYQR